MTSTSARPRQPRMRLDRRRVLAIREQPFPAPLRSPHIIVIDADLPSLDRTGRMLSGHGYGITLSSTMLNSETFAYLAPDLVIVDIDSIKTEGPIVDLIAELVATLNVAVILCEGKYPHKWELRRPGIVKLAKPFHEPGLLSAVETLRSWRAAQAQLSGADGRGPGPSEPAQARRIRLGIPVAALDGLTSDGNQL